MEVIFGNISGTGETGVRAEDERGAEEESLLEGVAAGNSVGEGFHGE